MPGAGRWGALPCCARCRYLPRAALPQLCSAHLCRALASSRFAVQPMLCTTKHYHSQTIRAVLCRCADLPHRVSFPLRCQRYAIWPFPHNADTGMCFATPTHITSTLRCYFAGGLTRTLQPQCPCWANLTLPYHHSSHGRTHYPCHASPAMWHIAVAVFGVLSPGRRYAKPRPRRSVGYRTEPMRHNHDPLCPCLCAAACDPTVPLPRKTVPCRYFVGGLTRTLRPQLFNAALSLACALWFCALRCHCCSVVD